MRTSTTLFVAGAITAPLAAQAPPLVPFHIPYDDITDHIVSDSSPVTHTFALGSSRDGRPLKIIVVSDNPAVIEDEPVLLFTGAIHGREPIGARILLEMVDDLASGHGSDPDITHWVDSLQIWVIPVMNPWGYDNQYRKNGDDTTDPATSGVDLNRNFPFRWSRLCCDDPMASDFGGPSPESEPETATMRALVGLLRPVLGVTIHSGLGNQTGYVTTTWSTVDKGEDGIDGTCDDLEVSPSVDRSVALDLAAVFRKAVGDSRRESNGRLCNGSSDIVGACADPGVTPSNGWGTANCDYNATTGMIDLACETNGALDGMGLATISDVWRDSYFYDDPLPSLTFEEAKHFLDGLEYVRNWKDGIIGLIDHFAGDPVLGFRGPGLTGIVRDHGGNPISATVRVLELDTTLDVDFWTFNCSLLVPYGGTDLEWRTARPNTGRYFRLLDPGVYNVEFSAAGHPTVVRTLYVGGMYLTELDVVLQSPPVADAGPSQILECVHPSDNTVQLDGSGSSDADGPGDIVSHEWFTGTISNPVPLASGVRPIVQLAPGHHTVRLRVTDVHGEEDWDATSVDILDTRAPALSVDVVPSMLWPADDSLVTVLTSVQVFDPCDATVPFALVAVTSDEPLDPSDVQDAAFGTADRKLRLRATRTDREDGRTYFLHYEATDTAGNRAHATCEVRVPGRRARRVPPGETPRIVDR